MAHQVQVFYTTRQAAQMIGVARSTLQKWIDEERIRPARTLGGHYRFTLEDINQIREEMELPPLDNPS